jgi:hypothetical protein
MVFAMVELPRVDFARQNDTRLSGMKDVERFNLGQMMILLLQKRWAATMSGMRFKLKTSGPRSLAVCGHPKPRSIELKTVLNLFSFGAQHSVLRGSFSLVEETSFVPLSPSK